MRRVSCFAQRACVISPTQACPVSQVEETGSGLVVLSADGALKMNSFLARANAVFAFTLTVLAALTFLCFLSTVWYDYDNPIHVRTKKVLVYVHQAHWLAADADRLVSENKILFSLQQETRARLWCV